MGIQPAHCAFIPAPSMDMVQGDTEHHKKNKDCIEPQTASPDIRKQDSADRHCPACPMQKRLLHNYQEIVILALLYKDILVVEQALGIYYLVKSSEFLLVYRDATALHQLTHLTF